MAKDGPGHYLREWRKHRGLTLEQVAERVELLGSMRPTSDPDATPVTTTHATLSRVERGKLPYSQPLMEILADVYQVDVATLIRINPEQPETIYSIWETLPATERRRVVEIAKALQRTGTGD